MRQVENRTFSKPFHFEERKHQEVRGTKNAKHLPIAGNRRGMDKDFRTGSERASPETTKSLETSTAELVVCAKSLT